MGPNRTARLVAALVVSTVGLLARPVSARTAPPPSTVPLQLAGVTELPPTAPPPTSLPLQLTGVMVDAKAPAASECFIRCLKSDERHGALKVGDIACGEAEIKEIRESGVVIRNVATNRLELLAFPPETRKPSVPPPVPAQPPVTAATPPPASPVTTVEIPKATVERYLSNLNELLQSALAVPHYSASASGQPVMDGFTLSRIKEGGAADQVGLRDGDIVQEVNGQPLDSTATVMALFGRMPTMTQAQVVVLRGGQRMTFLLTVK